MKEAFLYARTETSVALGAGDRKLRAAVHSALDRTVIVRTPARTIGAGAVIGNKVITSLFLVGNFAEVAIRFPKGKSMSAFVARRDAERNLAELVPSDRALSFGNRGLLAASPDPKVGQVQAIGDPLLMVNVACGVPVVQVAGTLYVTSVSERFGETWRIRSEAPRGLIGGAVWDPEGKIIGLSIGERIPPPNDPGVRLTGNVYAISGEEAMEFAESD